MVEQVSWTFYGYQTPAGGKGVQEWFDGLLEEEKDEARDRIGYLQKLPVAQWRKPEFAPLGDGLSEIRFRVNTVNKVVRIYGCFWPKHLRFSYSLLLGAEKKVKNPSHHVAEARKRLSRLERNEASVHEFEL